MNITLQPDVLRWVRERAGLSQSDLATGLRIQPERVAKWERSGEISFAMAERLAGKVRAPFGYLYLDQPPNEQLQITDYRTIGSEQIRGVSPDLLDTLDEAEQRQKWYREYLESIGAEPLAFVDSITTKDDPKDAASKIRNFVGIDTELRASVSNWEDALTLQIEQIEETRVLIMRNGVVGSNTSRPLSVDEFRGFALCDSLAPLIFINGKDAKAAQMFTLFHELVHIWVGASGVSNPQKTYTVGSHGVEAFCNAVAAEILVPEADIEKLWRSAENRDDPFTWLANRFKVSSLVILRRVRDLKYVSEAVFAQEYREREKKYLAGRKTTKGGNYYATQRLKVGTNLARAVIQTTFEGKTPYRDALRLLGMSDVNTLHRFAEKLNIVP
jgi:Zn-dependent peptidase ImmA (M78 family)